MEMLGKVRRMHQRDNLSLREISKRTGLSRNTLRKWLRKPDEEVISAPGYHRDTGVIKLTPYHGVLELALKADALRIKQNRRTAMALFQQIKADGYTGGYSRLTDFTRQWRGQEGNAPRAFVPLSFEQGEAFQFDWSEEGLVIGGIYRRIQVSHLKLCASRAFWLVAYPSQGHEMLFDAHTRSFAALGGVPRRGIYDNMKTAVDKVNKGKGRIVNARFAVMCAHYLFDASFCNVASGWEKGVVEKNVQDSRRRIWIEAQTMQFTSFAELNAWLAQRCRTLWSELRHPEHRTLSVADVLEQEQSQMMPMPTPFDGYVEKPARVSSTCLVAVSRNRYSVPCEYAGRMVSARLYPSRVCIVVDDVVVATHERVAERGQVRYDWEHYIPLVQRKPGALRNGAPFLDMPAPLMRLKHGLLRHVGGDRVMAQVLAVVPTAGLAAVLVAVELVVESGVLSVEHVENVLARLNASPVPASVETSLQLKEAPLANTGRYDSLRATNDNPVEVNHA
ncbi:IS21 family transposase [Collimonas sp.]|jgi:transposase|uniref:IS21 family transposase n=1 Tax=Collimonas sp. TaxID=1963772 RepID=UPI0037C10312